MALGGGSMAGYSGTPLVKKLGVKPAMTVTLLGAPAGWPAPLGELPADVRIGSALSRSDLVMIFVTESAELARQIEAIKAAIAPDGMAWVAWPKRAAKVPTDMTEDVVREIALPTGLVDVKVCAIDDTWSGLKLVIRRALR